jgi:hypothetical protein
MTSGTPDVSSIQQSVPFYFARKDFRSFPSYQSINLEQTPSIQSTSTPPPKTAVPTSSLPPFHVFGQPAVKQEATLTSGTIGSLQAVRLFGEVKSSRTKGTARCNSEI